MTSGVVSVLPVFAIRLSSWTEGGNRYLIYSTVHGHRGHQVTKVSLGRIGHTCSVSTYVAKQVRCLPKGQLFSIRRFEGVGTKNAVSKAVARLIKRGELERVYRGVYMRPKAGRFSASAPPDPWQLISLIAKEKRLSLQIHGADAVRKFGLSTQVPLILIFYTNGASRSVFIGKGEIRLIHAPPMVMQHAGTKVGAAISALFYLGKAGATPECVGAIKNALSHENLICLMNCRMPAWMRIALEKT